MPTARIFFLAVCGAAGFLSPILGYGQDSPAPQPSPAAAEKIAPGVYRIGPVTMDKNAREVRFPAVVNQTRGAVEYLLVGSQGKTHESVLRTDAEPVQVHTAMLLLGVESRKPKPDAKKPAPAPSAIDPAYLAGAPLPEGAPVTLLVRWQPADGGERVNRRAESLIDNTQLRAPMTEGIWLYNGSFFAEGRFEAQAEKSFAALVTDPSALMNNPRPGHDNDTIWSAAPDRLPPAETPVEFVIQLPAPTP